MHLFDRATNFCGGNAIVGGGLPLAVGLALADRMRGDDIVTACFFGDGAVAEGEFHESLNLAALWSLPVLFVCENNLYAMGTALAMEELKPTCISRRRAIGLLPRRSTAWTWSPWRPRRGARSRRCARPANHTFSSAGPIGLPPHSMFDAQLYRDQGGGRERGAGKDPRVRFRGWALAANHLAPRRGHERASGRGIAVEVDTPRSHSAEAGTWEPVEDLTRFVYAEKSH